MTSSPQQGVRNREAGGERPEPTSSTSSTTTTLGDYGLSAPKEHGLSVPGTRRDSELHDLARRPDIVERLVSSWGGSISTDSRCPLPGHHGRATIAFDTHPDAEGAAKLACWCHAQQDGRPRYFGLGQVRAWRSYRGLKSRTRVEQLSPVERLTWLLRLATDVGVVEPVAVELARISPQAPEDARRAWDAFGLLAGLRAHLSLAGEPIPYAGEFVAAWAGIPRDPAYEAVRFLRGAHLLVVERQARRLPLYRAPKAISAYDPRRELADEEGPR